MSASQGGIPFHPGGKTQVSLSTPVQALLLLQSLGSIKTGLHLGI